MSNNLFSFPLKTERTGFFDITDKVNKIVEESGVKEGICLIFCPHTTASITINENADEFVAKDVDFAMSKIFPKMPEFRHDEGNSDCHVKCSVMGASETVIITEGKVLLGRWQAIYFSEFDPPRSRTIYVKIIEG